MRRSCISHRVMPRWWRGWPTPKPPVARRVRRAGCCMRWTRSSPCIWRRRRNCCPRSRTCQRTPDTCRLVPWLDAAHAFQSIGRMRIVIMGAGGLGGYFGARLAAAGNDVAFVARGPHLAAIRQNGLRVESALGDLHLRDVVATDNPATLAPADIVIVGVKLWDLETAAQAVKSLLRAGTAV